MSNKIIEDAVAMMVATDIAGVTISDGAGQLWLIQRSGVVNKEVQNELTEIEAEWHRTMKEFKAMTPPVKEDSPTWKSAFELYETKVDFEKCRMKATKKVLPR